MTNNGMPLKYRLGVIENGIIQQKMQDLLKSCYQSAIVSTAPPCTIFELLDTEKYRNLKI